MPRSTVWLPIRLSVSTAKMHLVYPPIPCLNEVVMTGVPLVVVMVEGDLEVVPLDEVEGVVVDIHLILLIGEKMCCSKILQLP